MEYENPYSPIKKCFNSRSNLVDHLKKLVELDLLKEKTIFGKNHYRFDRTSVGNLIYAYNYAWFTMLLKKIPNELLTKMRADLVSKYGDEIKKHDAFFISYRI